MRILGIALLTLCLPNLAAEEPDRSVIYGRSYAGQPLPAFDKGYLLFTNRPNNVEVWGPDGQLVFRTVISNPPGAKVMSIAIDTRGEVAVSVAHSTSQGWAGGIARLDRTGKQNGFFDTGRYMPAHVAFGADSALWAFGWQRDSVNNETADSEDYLMFRKYSLNGQQLGAYGPRSLLPTPGLSPGSTQGGLWRLRIAKDRVGAIAYSGRTSQNLEWIELGLDGQLIGHWSIGDSSGGWAFLSDGSLCRQSPDGETSRIDRFDRATQSWKPLRAVGKLGILLGAQDHQLVFGHDQGTLRLTWLPASGQ